MAKKWTGEKKLVPQNKAYLQKRPVDFDLIDYGDSVPNSVLEDFYNVSEDDESFRFKQIQFIQQLDRELRSRGKVCTICVREGQVTILTHEEAAEYNRKRFNCHISGMAKTHEKNIHVDRDCLTNSELDKHDDTVMFQSRILQSILNVRAEHQIEMVERKTPGLIPIKTLDAVVLSEDED
jgi:hypothetical protein